MPANSRLAALLPRPGWALLEDPGRGSVLAGLGREGAELSPQAVEAARSSAPSPLQCTLRELPARPQRPGRLAVRCGRTPRSLASTPLAAPRLAHPQGLSAGGRAGEVRGTGVRACA